MTTAWHGRLVGDADGVLTADGELRLKVVDPATQTPAQVAGHVDVEGSEAVGTGVIVGQECAAFASSRFCAGPAAAEIRMSAAQTRGEVRITSEIRVTTDSGVETWTFELGHWGNFGPGYLDTGDGSVVAGLYRPRVEFLDADTVVSIDGAGRVFFQSPGTGCIGNGIVTPRRIQADLYDVRLTLASCTGDFAAWNGEVDGLATLEAENRWDYSLIYGLRFWVSSPAGTSAGASARASAGLWWPIF